MRFITNRLIFAVKKCDEFTILLGNLASFPGSIRHAVEVVGMLVKPNRGAESNAPIWVLESQLDGQFRLFFRRLAECFTQVPENRAGIGPAREQVMFVR